MGRHLRAAVVSAAVACTIAPLPEAAHAAGRYVAVGDSISTGFQASDPATKGFVPLFLDFLKTPEGGGLDELVNEAEGGVTSGDVRSDGQLTRARADIADDATDTVVVTVTVGGNDLRAGDCATGWGDPGTCPFVENFQAILARLLEELAADPGDEELFVMTYFNPAKGTANEAAVRQRLLGSDNVVDCSGTGGAVGLNDAIDCLGTQQGAIVVDTYTPFDTSPDDLIAADNLHPNDAGYAVIADEFEKKRTKTQVPPAPPPDPGPANPGPPGGNAPPPPGATSTPPTNVFTLRSPRIGRNGTATLPLDLPGPGALTLRASARGIPNVARVNRSVARAGRVNLKIKPSRRARAALKKSGKLKITAKVAYTPTGGSPRTTTRKLTLKRAPR
jgi:lysophospholipase L1-like esterase